MIRALWIHVASNGEPMALKQCEGSCRKKLPVSEFYMDRGSPKTKCKECYKKAQRVPERSKTPQETLTQVEEHRLKVRNAELAAQVKDLVETASRNDEMSEFVREVMSQAPVKGIRPRERKSGLSEATPLIMASDWHIEEEVRPEQVAGRNRYNLEISKDRMERFFEAVRWATSHQRQIFKIRDMILWLGGDFITNYLHADNNESNLLSPVEAIAYAHSSIAAGINFLLEDKELERLVIPCNDGNHGRLTDKMHSSTRVENSIEWLLYYQLQREFRNEKRVEFVLPTSSFSFFDVYGRTIRFTHGDTFRFGGGVGGLMIPLLKALARWESVRRADLTCVAHWHQRINLRNVMVNGCFVSGTKVLTDTGPKPIESIVAGDTVLSHDGTFQTVQNTLSKVTSDLVRFRVKGLPNFIECTPNHEIFTVKGESSQEARPGRQGTRSQTTIINEQPQWVKAEYLSEGDWVHTPSLKGTQVADLDLLWTFGLFLAEGHTIVNGGSSEKHFRIEFTMHLNEYHVLERVKSILDKALGREGVPTRGLTNTEGRIWKHPKKTTSSLSYSGEHVAHTYREQFGHLAIGKKVPSWMFGLSVECRQAVVQGWFDGDGHAGACTTAATISEDLAWGMLMLATGTALEPMLYCDGARKIRQGVYGRSFRVSFVKGQDVRWVGSERFLRIDHRRRISRETTVHDLQVSGQHTYCVEGVGVHNSLIGFNSYAQDIAASFESPVQSLRMLEPKRFCSTDVPLWVSKVQDDDDAI